MPDPAALGPLTLRLLRDDGAVVYINGMEVFRSNMPAGTVTYTTPASTAVGGADEQQFYTSTVDSSALVVGSNVIAVELHQSGGTSTDLSFDLELTATVGSGSAARPVSPARDALERGAAVANERGGRQPGALWDGPGEPDLDASRCQARARSTRSPSPA